MSFLSRLFGGKRLGSAAYLARTMATENDRVMRGQITEWADSVFWSTSPAPTPKSPTDLSLGTARLIGAAMPLGYVHMVEPESFEKLRSEVLRSYPIWSSGGGKLQLDASLAEQKLDIFVSNVQMLPSLPDTGLAALGKHWADGLIDSWSGTDLGTQLLNQRHEILMTMIAAAFQHVSQELQ